MERGRGYLLFEIYLIFHYVILHKRCSSLFPIVLCRFPHLQSLKKTVFCSIDILPVFLCQDKNLYMSFYSQTFTSKVEVHF